jgi:RNA polymerase sigma factor (sigma-70 family)
MSDDPRIVAAVLERAPGAFERLVERHQNLVWHVVGRMVEPTEEVRELCQEVFLKVFQNLHQFRAESSLASWIGAIAFAVASRHLRRRRLPMVDADSMADSGQPPLLERVPDASDPLTELEREDSQARVIAALMRMPPLPRTLLSLYHLEELPIAEIARITDLPEGTIKSHLSRARLKLRQCLS